MHDCLLIRQANGILLKLFAHDDDYRHRDRMHGSTDELASWVLLSSNAVRNVIYRLFHAHNRNICREDDEHRLGSDNGRSLDFN